MSVATTRAVGPATVHHHASVGGTVEQSLSSAGKFFSIFASLRLVPVPVLIGLLCYALYLALRALRAERDGELAGSPASRPLGRSSTRSTSAGR